MRRAIRWAVNLLTAMSLLLCVATGAVLAHSHYRYDRAEYRCVTWRERVKPVDLGDGPVSVFPDEFQRCWMLQTYSAGGTMYVRVARGWDEMMKGRAFRASHIACAAPGQVAAAGAKLRLMFDEGAWPTDPAARRLIRLPGLRVVRPRDETYVAEGVVRLWLVAVVTGVLPGLWLHQRIGERRARRRAMVGLCRTCGYDLRATPARCPECGAITILTSMASA